MTETRALEKAMIAFYNIMAKAEITNIAEIPADTITLMTLYTAAELRRSVIYDYVVNKDWGYRRIALRLGMKPSQVRSVGRALKIMK